MGIMEDPFKRKKKESFDTISDEAPVSKPVKSKPNMFYGFGSGKSVVDNRPKKVKFRFM